MALSENHPLKLSSEGRLFAQKVARSIIEIESNVNNTADVVVLLEVLGYSKDMVAKYGFEDLASLANYVYDFLDAYEDKEKSKEDYVKTFTVPLESLNQRIAEGLGLIFPWLGSLSLLFITGVSLWMTLGLPQQISTALVVGVFLGLVTSEGLVQIFGKLFTFYREQNNIGEMKRLLKMNYVLSSLVLAGIVLGLYIYGFVAHIPFGLVTISSIATVTISLHRISYVIIFSMKKILQLIMAYSGAFAALLSIYYLSSPVIPGDVIRYFTGLASAFAVLSVFALYHNIKAVSIKPAATIPKNAPHFYKPRTQTDKTLVSNFRVQVFESLPNFLFGTFYFVLMFADRIISWSLNPIKAGGITLPLGFNSTYHMGADLALSVMVAASVIQYVLTGPVFKQITNMSVIYKVSEMEKIRRFIQKTYTKVMLLTLLASGVSAIVINLGVTQIPVLQDAPQVTLNILHIATIGNILLSVFSANVVFVMLLNKVKSLAIITIMSSMIIAMGGFVFGRLGLEDITLAYLAATAFAAAVSTIYIRSNFKNAPSIFFARYV